jgi:uncharacterized protein YbjT (DUF2867 family)
VVVVSDDGNDKHYGKAYTITGPEALSYYQAAEILSNATGKKIGYVNVSEDVTRLPMRDIGVDDWPVSTMSELFDLYRKGYATQVSSAGNQYPFSQFAKDYAQAVK